MAFCALALILPLSGCFPAPLLVARPVDITVVDAESGRPIAGASLVYLACDVHDFKCRDARLVRTTAAANGTVKVPGRRQWGIWISAPGGLPVPMTFIAVWSPEHSAFIHGDFDQTVESLKLTVERQDILDALDSIPSDRSSADPSLNTGREFRRGTILLQKRAP